MTFSIRRGATWVLTTSGLLAGVIALTGAAPRANPLLGTWHFDHFGAHSAAAQRQIRQVKPIFKAATFTFRSGSETFSSPPNHAIGMRVRYTVNRHAHTVRVTRRQYGSDVTHIFHIVSHHPEMAYEAVGDGAGGTMRLYLTRGPAL